MSDLEEAWAELHAATPPGWRVGRPYRHEERGAWEQYAWLPSSRAGGAGPKRDWIAVGATEVACVREMTRCLLALGEGRWPE